MGDSYAVRNESERLRLQTIVARLSDIDLTRAVNGEWTVSATLMHVAFYDRLALARWEKWERVGVPSQRIVFESDLVNAAALPQWLAVPGREAVREVVAAAEAVDRKIEHLAPLVVSAYLEFAAGSPPRMLDRTIHRREHLDHIVQALTSR